MSATVIIAGGATLVGLHRLLKSREEADHDDVTEQAYHELREAADPSTKISVAHIQDRDDVNADGHVRSATPGEEHEPDIVVDSFADNKLVIEVETGASLDSEALSQLRDFSTAGYTRLLVVPEGIVDDGETFLEETGSTGRRPVEVCSPSGVARHL